MDPLTPWGALLRPNLPRQAWHTLVWILWVGGFLYLLQRNARTPALQIGLPSMVMGCALMALPCVMLSMLIWYGIVRPRWLREEALRQRIAREGMYAALPVWQNIVISFATALPCITAGHHLWLWVMDNLALWSSATRAFYTLPTSMAVGLFGMCVMLPVDMMRVRWQHERLRAETTQRQLAEARLQRLQAQLEPHMLFNTLSNLHALIETQPARAQDMLAHLIDYLRATLGASRTGRFTLAEEMRLVEDYLALMQIRMGTRLRVRIDLPAALHPHPWLPMLLQPLVENAVLHGLDPLPEGGLLHIEAGRTASRLWVRVSDDGRGLPASPGRDDSFGLTCVRERLSTTHGEDAGLSLQAAQPRGTVATVHVPLAPGFEPLHAPAPLPTDPGLIPR